MVSSFVVRGDFFDYFSYLLEIAPKLRHPLRIGYPHGMLMSTLQAVFMRLWLLLDSRGL